MPGQKEIKANLNLRKKVQFGTFLALLQRRFSVAGWLAGLKVGAGSRGCSCPENSGCDVACTHPDKGPGSPGRGPAAPGCAVSPRTCGCVPCAPARCGSSRRTSSGCAARWGWSGRPCGCSVAFFGSAGSREAKTDGIHWSASRLRVSQAGDWRWTPTCSPEMVAG